MKRANRLYLILIILFIGSCSDELLHQSDHAASVVFDEGSQLTLQQRSEIAKSQLKSNEFTRWDAPWWDMSDEDMADSLRATDGEVIISFKEPGQLAGVDERGEVLVNDQTRNSGINAIKEAGAEILRESKLHPSVLARAPVDTELISTLRNHPLVDIFEPNVTGRYLNTTWNIDRVNAPDIWNQTTGTGARLLIIDSGVDNTHTDLDPEVIHGCDNTNGVDQLGHGTSVSGVVAALQNGQDVVGVAHNVELWSSSVGNPAPVAQFILCAVAYGRTNNVDVMNMSVSVTPLSALTDEINAAYNQDNIILVSAAGNTFGGAVTYPANLSSVIAVTATDINDDRWAGAAIGPEIEIAAPGVNVETTSLGGGTATVTGTSFAAPHVAGAAALLRSYNSSWSNHEIRTRLNISAQTIPGSPDEVGNGLLDIAAAIEWLPAPTITHSVQNGNPRFTWSTVFGADEYEIQRRHFVPDTWDHWTTVSSSPYLDTITHAPSLQAISSPNPPGPEHWVGYRIRAVNQHGTSQWSQARYFIFDESDVVIHSDHDLVQN